MPIFRTAHPQPTVTWVGVLLSLLLCALPALAAAQDAAPMATDAPARVARLAYVEGDLGLLPAGAATWSDVRVNRPLTTGDRLSSGSDARAELELGGASMRMDAGTDIGFLNLNEQLVQVELTQGTLNVSVRDLARGQSYEIDTPTIALVLDAPGVYRVDINADGGVTSVTAFSGDATAYGENGVRQLLQAGNFYRFEDSGLRDVRVSDIRGEDAFDRWSAGRDARYADSRDAVYATNDMVGVQDLDQYGQWQDDDEYGHVWYPDDVASDWAPYQDGQWTWIDPWGWTWVDNAPWGFAPFHYGRWGYVHNRWGWIPGPRGVRSVYAPALVAFVGGNTWGVSIGFGGSYPVGWFPLGPGDIYDPWYRYSRAYYTQVNITNIYVRDHRHRQHVRDRLAREYGVYQKPRPLRDIHYANRHAPHATTVVAAKAFTSGGSVRAGRLHVNPKRLHDAPVLADVGSMHALRPAVARHRAAPPGALPLSGFEREVVARHVPAARAWHARPGAKAPSAGATAQAHGKRADALQHAPTIAHERPRVRLLKGAAPATPRAWKPGIAANNADAGAGRIRPVRVPEVKAAAHSHRVTDTASTSRSKPAHAPTALRSSQFVHPRATAPRVVDRGRAPATDAIRPARARDAQRPGVSFVGNSHTKPSRPNPAVRTNELPRVVEAHRSGPTANSLPRARPRPYQPATREAPTPPAVIHHAPKRDATLTPAPRPDFRVQRAPPRTLQHAPRQRPQPRVWHATPAAPSPRPRATPARKYTPPPVRSEKRTSHPVPKRVIPTSNDDDDARKRRGWKH